MKIELKINPEYEKILPKLSEEEYEALKNSIKENGQLYPIIVNEEDVILDGHHRYKACKELGIEPKIERRTFQDKLLEKKFVIEVNLKRRHLLPFQRAEMGMALLEIEKELARQRKLAGKTLGSIETKVGRATEIVGKKVGLSRATFERALEIIEKAPEFVKEKARTGEISINEGYVITSLLEKVEDPKKREALSEKLENGELTANDLKKIVVFTEGAYSLLENKPNLLKEFEDKFWTPELDLNEIKNRINEYYGKEEMKELKIAGLKAFKDELEASNWIAQFEGDFNEVYWSFSVPKRLYDKAQKAAEERMRV